MPDSVLVKMPDDPREFFLAMPAIQDYIYQYVQEVHHQEREPGYSFTFRMKDDFEEYELPLKVAKEVVPQFDYSGWSVKNRSEFNCFIDFDFESAKKIALTTGKHITECLGILIGSNPTKRPILAPPRCTQGKGVLVLPWASFDNAVKLADKLKDANVFGSLPIDMDFVKNIDIDTVEGVIGPASVLTHLAASHNRKIVEIFPDMASYNLYNNEGIQNYQAIIGDSFGPELVLQAWKNLIPEELYAQ